MCTSPLLQPTWGPIINIPTLVLIVRHFTLTLHCWLPCVLTRRKSWRKPSCWCLQTNRIWTRQWHPLRWPTLWAFLSSKTENGRSLRPRPQRVRVSTRRWNGRFYHTYRKGAIEMGLNGCPLCWEGRGLVSSRTVFNLVLADPCLTIPPPPPRVRLQFPRQQHNSYKIF